MFREGNTDDQSMQQQLQEKQLHVLVLFFPRKRWLSRDTVHWQAGKRWKGTDWSLARPMQELGSSMMVLGAWLKQKEAIYHVVASALVECWHRWKSLCEYQWDSTSIWKRSKQTSGLANILSWKQADTRRVSGHHVYLVYSFPSVVVSKHEIPVKTDPWS